MSIATTSNTSIESYGSGEQFAGHVGLVASILRDNGPMAGTDVRVKAAEFLGKSNPAQKNTDISTASRLTDCWRDLGAIRKTGRQVESVSTKKHGDEWEFVPNDPKLRLQARLEFWLETEARYTQELKKGEKNLAEAGLKVAELKGVLGQFSTLVPLT
jgi:hypothetical protein